MSANFFKLFVVSFVIFFFAGCKDKDVSVIKNKEKIIIERETLSIEVYANKIKELEKSLEESKKALEESNKKIQDLNRKLEDKKPETASLPFGATYSQELEIKRIREEFETKIRSLTQENQFLRQEAEAFKKQSQELGQEVEKLMREKQYQDNQRAMSQSIVSSLDDNERAVPVRIEIFGLSPYSRATPGRAPVKITNKRTGEFFIYEINENYGMSGPGGPINVKKVITLIPGEYTIEVSKNASRFSVPKSFMVSKKPLAEIDGQKIHAVIRQ